MGLPRLVSSEPLLRFGIPGQALPADSGLGLHVRAGRLQAAGGTPDVIAVANGRAGIDVLRNLGGHPYERLSGAIPWNVWTDGRASDVCFLDLLDGAGQPSPVGDGVDDHLFVAVADNPSEFRTARDRLFRVSLEAGVLVHEDVSALLPPEDTFETRHQCQTVIASRRLDPAASLCLVLAGGFHGQKNHLDASREPDHLRILRYAPQGGAPAFEVHDIDPPSAQMMDVDVLDANVDGLGDLLVATHDQGPLLLQNDPAAPLQFTVLDGAATWSLDLSDVPTLGAGVGDLDGDGDEDAFLLHQKEGHPPALYENLGGTFSRHSDGIVWQGYRDEYLSSFNRRAYEAVPIEHEGQIVGFAVAAETPFVLFRHPDDLGTPFRLRELDPRPGAGDDPGPVLSDPFLQVYSSQDLLLADLSGDGVEEILLADASEQNRLWACDRVEQLDPGTGDPLYTILEPVSDLTSGLFPAGGQMSTRVLVGDLDGDGRTDALTVNLDRPPNLYLAAEDPQGGSVLADGSHLFPEDAFRCDATECLSAGGWDGALADLDGDGHLDLVLAQGGWGTPKPDAVYRWDPGLPGFTQVIEAFPPPENDMRFQTRGVAAGDLDGDGCTDLAFAYQDGLQTVLGIDLPLPGGLRVFPGEKEAETCLGTFAEGEWVHFNPLNPLLMYRAVSLITYDDGRLPDLLAGRPGEIEIFRNDQAGKFQADPLDSGPMILDLGEQGPESTGVDPSLTRFVPMNLDEQDGPPDDFFVALQALDDRNALLRATGEPGEPRSFELIEGIGGGVQTWSAAVWDLNEDGYDDLLTLNGLSGNVRVLLNNYPGQIDPGGPILIDATDALFLDEGPEAYPNPDDALDAAFADLLDSDGVPELLIACDGQNRLLVVATGCDDGIPCTVDLYDETDGSCSHVPEHAACDDGEPCTSDVCDTVLGCRNIAEEDGDGDGYADELCPGGTDCDDTNPEVNPGMPEIPDNGLDDDCDPTTPDRSVGWLGFGPPGGEAVELGARARSEAVNGLGLLLLPLGTVRILHGLRRRQRAPAPR